MKMDISTLLTQVGALTSFAAFVMKCWEFYHDRRPRLRVTFAGVGSVGDVVQVFNSSKVPTTIHRYSVDTLPSTLLNKRRPRFDETETLAVKGTRTHCR